MRTYRYDRNGGLKSKILSQTELLNRTYVELEPKISFNIKQNPYQKYCLISS